MPSRCAILCSAYPVARMSNRFIASSFAENELRLYASSTRSGGCWYRFRRLAHGIIKFNEIRTSRFAPYLFSESVAKCFTLCEAARASLSGKHDFHNFPLTHISCMIYAPTKLHTKLPPHDDDDDAETTTSCETSSSRPRRRRVLHEGM